MTQTEERAKQVAEGIAEGIANTLCRADTTMDERGRAAAYRSAYDQVYGSVLRQLQRSERIGAVLRRAQVFEYDPETSRTGYGVVVREVNHAFAHQLSEVASKSLAQGTIIVPRGFDEYAKQIDEAVRYQQLLAVDGIHSELVVVPPHPMFDVRVALYIP